jgi:transcriptional regulator with XRE-family HTH domain
MSGEDRGSGIGSALRALREEQGLSVRTLASRSGFSASFISQVENGQSSPSIASMEKIARTLGVSLSEFFSAEPPEANQPGIVRAGEGPELISEWSQARLTSLGPSWEGRMLSPMLMTLAPGGRSGSHPSGHQAEEFALVLSGSVLLHLSGDTREMETGDAVHLMPETPHQWENTSPEPVRVVLVTSRVEAG